MAKKALDVHEVFAENLAYENEIMWDAYTPRQFHVFKQKLKELYRDPEPEGSKKNKAMEKIRETVYNQTISQTKYTNKNLLSTFILVTVAEGTTFLQARDAMTFSVHLIIRTRRCMKNDDSTNCCMIFIDEHGRCYQNWNHFMEKNMLPKGVAFAPSNGVYTFEDKKLIMDSWITPASGLGEKIVSTTDTVAGLSGFAAAGVTVAAAFSAPIAAPVLAGAGIVCLATGVYSAARSGWQLWTRSEHEQSISVTDQSARGCWIGVASGALAVGSSVANKALAQVALAGREVSLIQETVVNGMNISTMLLSGTGVANGIVDIILKYSDDEEINGLDYLQVAASLVIFTHSVYNFRLASTIVSQTQDSKLSSYRTELSNRQRRMFDKMTKETLRTQGASKGKMDVIRLINEVPDKQYLNDLHKINKNLNKKDVRFAAGKDAKVVLNDDVSVKPSVLRDSIQHGKGENILGKVNKPVPESHKTIQNQSTVNLLTSNAFAENSNNLANYCQSVLKVAEVLILNKDGFQNCVQYLIEHVGNDITEFLIHQAKEFVQKFRDTIESYIKTTLYVDTVLWDLYQQCKPYLEHLENVTLESLEREMKNIFDLLLFHYKEMSWNNPKAKKIECDVCKGFYEICSIE